MDLGRWGWSQKELRKEIKMVHTTLLALLMMIKKKKAY